MPCHQEKESNKLQRKQSCSQWLPPPRSPPWRTSPAGDLVSIVQGCVLVHVCVLLPVGFLVFLHFHVFPLSIWRTVNCCVDGYKLTVDSPPPSSSHCHCCVWLFQHCTFKWGLCLPSSAHLIETEISTHTSSPLVPLIWFLTCCRCSICTVTHLWFPAALAVALHLHGFLVFPSSLS